MKKEATSRRDFIKASLITGCFGAGFANVVKAQEKEDPCKEKLAKTRHNISAWYEKDKMKIIKKLKEKYGEELVEIVKQNTIDNTTGNFKNRNIEKRDLSAVKKLLWDNLEEGFEFTVVKDTPDFLEYKVTKCYLAEISKELKATDIGFALHCSWDYGFCKGVNPDIEFIRTKTLMEGNDCCNHTYKLKKK